MVFWAALAGDQNRPVPGAAAPSCGSRWPVPRAELAAALDAVLGNVFRYTPQGTAFEVAVSRRDGYVAIRVDDAGPGIANPDRALRRGASDQGSTGLGLDIARRVALQANGSVSLDRARLGGASVVMLLADPEATPRQVSRFGLVGRMARERDPRARRWPRPRGSSRADAVVTSRPAQVFLRSALTPAGAGATVATSEGIPTRRPMPDIVSQPGAGLALGRRLTVPPHPARRAAANPITRRSQPAPPADGAQHRRHRPQPGVRYAGAARTAGRHRSRRRRPAGPARPPAAPRAGPASCGQRSCAAMYASISAADPGLLPGAAGTTRCTALRASPASPGRAEIEQPGRHGVLVVEGGAEHRRVVGVDGDQHAGVHQRAAAGAPRWCRPPGCGRWRWGRPPAGSAARPGRPAAPGPARRRCRARSARRRARAARPRSSPARWSRRRAAPSAARPPGPGRSTA